MGCILELHAKVEAGRIDVADAERPSITSKLEMAVAHRGFIDALMEAAAVCRRVSLLTCWIYL